MLLTYPKYVTKNITMSPISGRFDKSCRVLCALFLLSVASFLFLTEKRSKSLSVLLKEFTSVP